MTAEIKATQQQSEERRLHLETVLSSLAVSVISLDADLRVLALNFPASRMLGISDSVRAVGKTLWEIVPQGFHVTLESLFESEGTMESTAESGFVLEKQFSLELRGDALEILATVAKTFDSTKRLNDVLLFDDLTELARAQQFAAWRDVAQRVAHEIKNPLTPIQLSAQRLQRLVGSPGLSEEVNAKVADCTQAIIENVDSIKRLSDESQIYSYA